MKVLQFYWKNAISYEKYGTIPVGKNNYIGVALEDSYTVHNSVTFYLTFSFYFIYHME